MEKDGLVNKVCQGKIYNLLFTFFLYVCYFQNYNFNIVLDTNKIYARLCDHRPFLNGEVRHFIREFEVHLLLTIYCLLFTL